MTTTRREFDRLVAQFDRIGFPLEAQPPASEADIQSILEVSGVNVDDSLKELWRISNGSGDTHWFARNDGGDDFMPFTFLSIDGVLNWWRTYAPYDASLYEEWWDNEDWGERDSRIQRYFLRHSKRIAFADFNNTFLMHFDADPTPLGTFGQVINYQHDPDAIDWRAESFLEFFENSNDVLEQGAEEDPERVAEQLWLL